MNEFKRMYHCYYYEHVSCAEEEEARAARCFAAKSRRRLAQMLLIQVTEVKGSLGRSSTFVPCTTAKNPAPTFRWGKTGHPSPAPRPPLPWRPRQEGQKRLGGVLKPRSTDSDSAEASCDRMRIADAEILYYVRARVFREFLKSNLSFFLLTRFTKFSSDETERYYERKQTFYSYFNYRLETFYVTNETVYESVFDSFQQPFHRCKVSNLNSEM